ncbi:Mix paired-like homeobox [Apophysomyces ossiformis]|uniref:Mix paired-like homeobox n=1 Tax=Apophysomyces ossiformis TaxID=679940 RepID=A0A8H7BTA5_9FUNG|nr:Mix paired-like homeobox [Apophysomyces ossiformis]
MVNTMIKSTSQETGIKEKQSSSSIDALLNPEPLREDNKYKTTKSPRSQVPTKAKRKRTSPDQFRALSELFEQTDTPNYELREKLAKKLNMTNREIQVWFQNRRAKRSRLQEQSAKQSALPDSQKRVHLQSVSTSFPFRQSTPHRPYVSKRCRDSRYEEEDDDSLSLPSVSSTDSIPTKYPSRLCVTSIDILATAAAYVQRWDEEQREREENERKRQRKEEAEQVQSSWRPWL